MEVKILHEEKNELNIQIDNPTVAELLRVYLNEDDDVKFAAWRKEHYSKPVVLKIRTEKKNAKKALTETITKIQKELKKYSEDFKKAKN